MDALITITPKSEVTDEYKKDAKKWTKWDSKNRKSFPYKYAAEERVLILEGSATLTPDDGSDPVTIEAGNAVTFHKGFKCKWKITKRMKKQYAVFQEEDAPQIVCDICDKGCVEESYFVSGEELDICPDCYKKDKKKYEGAEYQREGEKWVEPEEKPKKRRKTTSKKK